LSALLFGDGFDGVRAVLAFVSLLYALGYYELMERPAFALRTAVKTAAIAALVPLPLLGLGGTAMPRPALGLLAGALVLSSIGDYFLALQDGPRNFVRKTDRSKSVRWCRPKAAHRLTAARVRAGSS